MLVPLQRVKASRLPAHSLCLRTILKLEVQSTNGNGPEIKGIDELLEFKRSVLETMWQPLEEGRLAR